MTKYFQESAVLTPRDPSLDANTDEWPEFDLSNVTVHLPNELSSTTNLLLATEHHPLTVRGQLLPSEEHADLFLQPVGRKRINVEITDVKTFSYGQYTNGVVALWAAGRSGWYSINPGRAYKSMYNDMADAVNTFYFIVDAYRDPRKSGKGKSMTTLAPYSAHELFQKYATEVMEEPSELTEAAGKFYHHRDFILSSMVAGKEGIMWGHNPLFLHLSRRFSSDYANVKRRVRGPRTRSADAQKPNSLDPVETSSSAGSLKRKRGRPAVTNAKLPEPIDLDSTPEMDTVMGAELEDGSEESQTSRHQPSKSSMGRRTRQNPGVTAQPEISATHDRSDNSDDGAEKPQAHRKRKSLLRLKPSKASKSVTRSGKAPVPEGEPPDDYDQDDGVGDESDSASPDPATAEIPSHSRRPAKRRTVSGTHEDEGIDMADSHSEEDPAVTLTAAHGADQQEFETLPLRALGHQPDPVQEDTWICALDGCSHKVYTASNPESQKLIREHYALHAYDDDERVQLVKRLQAPSLPVRHLMERVRQQAKVEGFPGSRVAGTRYPGTVPASTVVQRY